MSDTNNRENPSDLPALFNTQSFMLFKTLVETPYTYLVVAILVMWVQVFAQIKVQKSGLCHEYKVTKLIENGLHANGVNVYV